MSGNTSLYIHFPFCRRRCVYCDFYSCVPGGGEDFSSLAEAYADKLIFQNSLLKREFDIGEYETVYLGGGTPSLIPPSTLRKLMNRLSPGKQDSEITMEVNPESLTGDLLEACFDSGINRISMGIQSLRPDVLASMGRLAGREENLRAVRKLRDWGGHWSLDLIFAYPGQTAETQIQDLEEFLSLEPPHFSLYQLTVEEGTRLHRNCLEGINVLPGEEEMELAWVKALALIEKAGYERYEISSYCRDGQYSKHNVAYWDRGAWLGLGSGATSLMGEKHRFTGKSWEEYLKAGGEELKSRGNFYRQEWLNSRDVLEESLMMGLRTKWGISRTRLEALFESPRVGEIIGNSLGRWKGRLEWDERGLRLNSRGLDWHSAVMVDLLLDLDNYFDYNTPL